MIWVAAVYHLALVMQLKAVRHRTNKEFKE